MSLSNIAFSIEAVVRVGASGQANRNIIGKYDPSGAFPGRQFQLYTWNVNGSSFSNSFGLHLYSGNAEGVALLSYSTLNSFTNGTICHVIARYSNQTQNPGDISFVVNGKPLANGFQTELGSFLAIADSGADIEIGAAAQGTGDQYRGDVFEVNIYTNALTDQAALDRFNTYTNRFTF